MSSPSNFHPLSPPFLPSPSVSTRKRKSSDVDWELIMDECKEAKMITHVAENHPETSYNAIRKRWKRFKSGDTTANIDRHGEGHQIFSLEEEEILATRIRIMRDEGVPISQNVVRDESINHFNEIHGTHQIRQNDRDISLGFIRRMKIRQGFSSQKLSKKETVKSFSEEELKVQSEEFKKNVRGAIEIFGPNFVFNMDETPAPFMEIPRSTWGDKGAKQKYVAKTLKRMKGGVTLMPTVSASGQKLKLAWINQGKTSWAIDKMSLPPDIFSFFSKKGWTTEEVMLDYLQKVIINHTKGRNCALILDDFGAHWTPAVQKAAEEGRIELIRVPKGMTSVLQPLDVSFNSQFKLLRILECQKEMIRNTGALEEKEKIVLRASVAYHKVTKEIVLRGWKLMEIDQ
jgi:hypothetical protein